MKVCIETHQQFEKDIKRLAKKYKSIAKDYALLLSSLSSNPLSGTDLGNGVRKVRMAIASKGKGKSGGARVITYTITDNGDGTIEITLLTMYDKGEMSNVSDSFIKSLLRTI